MRAHKLSNRTCNVSVKVYSFWSDIDTIINRPLPSLVLDTHHLISLGECSAHIIQVCRQLEPLRHNCIPPGRLPITGSMDYRMRRLPSTSTHDQQWESKRGLLIVNPKLYPLDKMLKHWCPIQVIHTVTITQHTDSASYLTITSPCSQQCLPISCTNTTSIY